MHPTGQAHDASHRRPRRPARPRLPAPGGQPPRGGGAGHTCPRLCARSVPPVRPGRGRAGAGGWVGVWVWLVVAVWQCRASTMCLPPLCTPAWPDTQHSSSPALPCPFHCPPLPVQVMVLRRQLLRLVHCKEFAADATYKVGGVRWVGWVGWVGWEAAGLPLLQCAPFGLPSCLARPTSAPAAPISTTDPPTHPALPAPCSLRAAAAASSCLLVQDPCSSLMLRDAICPSCQDCQDLDLCRDPAVRAPAGAVQCCAVLCGALTSEPARLWRYTTALHCCCFCSVGSPCLPAYACTS